ncbi:LacI family DNA-binding transcriptional regulator [Allomeiothermus silvanus]|uniref:LacI family DNA-binding transcriptional regulator n=1 Tax=Allomeiothermus silvanus TaxID=52022 RepID=UPI0023F38C53|nr:LacI family DNA-binding transcriptional regulator [Allomeiothermus silvanus]
MNKVATLTDVAARARVSLSTASRALNGLSTVDPELRARVVEAARELGYRPNQVAKSLRQQKTRIIAHVTAGITASFHATLAQGVQDAAFNRGYTMILGNTGTGLADEVRYLQVFEDYKVDGMVVVPVSNMDPYLEHLSTRIPIVEVDRTFGNYSKSAVLLDNEGAIREATEHLLALGHRRIGLIYGLEPVNTEIERKEGFVKTLEQHGIPIDSRCLVRDHYTEEGGYRAGRLLLSSEARVTAVIVTTNEALAGLVRAARSLELSIPGDISVIGMDDARWTQLMEPPLTVIEQPAYDMGYEAANILLDYLEYGKIGEPRVRRLPARLILRKSTAVPKRR